MYVVLLIIYILIVLVMIAVVLIQEPRTGGGLGIAFGGGVENVIGVKTAPTFFTNLTIGLGAAFGILAFLLSLMSGARTGSSSVVVREAGKGTVYKVLEEIQSPAGKPAQAPVTPVQPQGQQPAPQGK
ncbi:MAG: preprotein translocase subunit SecG [Thermotogae bacterium]|nr:preprotein translocase subunit SecG [Thermotogota bacterium]